MGNSLNSNLDALFGKLENFITSKTVVGEPVFISNVILLPLVDVTFGVGAGAGANETEQDKLKKDFGGGGLGAKITPAAVLVIHDGNVQLVSVKNQDNVNKLIDMVPGVLSKFNFDKFFGKKAEATEESE
ncbi:MAG: GerW family sporulation protein [Clostridiales bacterium]|nr:GerW family sporulation protein [Clostridiales bacterium]